MREMGGHSGQANVSVRVLKAMGLFGGVRMASILCGIIRIKLVALWLGPAGVGLFGIFNNAIDMVRSFSELGLRSSLVRDIASVRDRVSVGAIVTVVRRWGWLLGVFGAVVMSAVAPILSLKTFGSYDRTLSFMLLAVVVFLGSVSMAEEAVMQGLDKLHRLARASLLGVAAGLVVSVPMLYFWRMDGIVPSIIAYGVTGCCAVLYYRVSGVKSMSHVSARETFTRGRSFVMLGIYMTAADFLTQFMSYVFIAYLNNSGGDAEVGYYQAGYTVVNRYAGILLSAIVMEYYPRLAASAGSRLRVGVFAAHEMLLILIAMMPTASVLISLAPFVVSLLYTSEFGPVVSFVTVAMVGVVLRGISYCLSYVILAKGDGVVLLVTESLSTVVGLVLNIIGYKFYGMTGLGVSYALWYLIYVLIVGTVYFRRYRLRLPFKVLAISGCGVCVVALCAWMALAFTPLATLPLTVGVCAVSLYGLSRLVSGRKGGMRVRKNL